MIIEAIKNLFRPIPPPVKPIYFVQPIRIGTRTNWQVANRETNRIVALCPTEQEARRQAAVLENHRKLKGGVR